jgi:hypothetical protein
VSKRALVAGVLAALAGSLAIAFSAIDSGDWKRQVYPAVSALAHAEPGRFLDLQPVYGSVAALVEAPFVALSLALGGGELLAYRLSVFPCLLALSLLALALGRSMHERGRRPLVCFGVSTLVLVNPATLAAIELGHPEELLCAAFAVGSVLAATRERPWLSALMLALAIATKQLGTACGGARAALLSRGRPAALGAGDGRDRRGASRAARDLEAGSLRNEHQAGAGSDAQRQPLQRLVARVEDGGSDRARRRRGTRRDSPSPAV